MEFAVGQTVWYLYDYDPTLNWVVGIVVDHLKGSFGHESYTIALNDGSLIQSVPVYNKYLDRYVIRPHFGHDFFKPSEDVTFHRSIHA
jgi:hypothetical protein